MTALNVQIGYSIEQLLFEGKGGEELLKISHSYFEAMQLFFVTSLVEGAEFKDIRGTPSFIKDFPRKESAVNCSTLENRPKHVRLVPEILPSFLRSRYEIKVSCISRPRQNMHFAQERISSGSAVAADQLPTAVLIWPFRLFLSHASSKKLHIHQTCQ